MHEDVTSRLCTAVKRCSQRCPTHDIHILKMQQTNTH